MFKVIAGVLGVIVLMIGLGWFLAFNDLAFQSYFQPKYEQVRRNTFEQSKAYNQGMIQELQNMQFQYIQADDEHKKALASIILHRVADYNSDNLPPDLYAFVQQLRNDRSH